MALLDFLKRKKQAEKKRGEKKPASVKIKAEKPVKKTEKVLVAAKPESKKEPEAFKAVKIKGFSYEAVKQPHISEKATDLSEKKNQYIFKVSSNYNKQEIKKAIEGIYGVNALSVNIIKIPAKKRRLGRTEGFKKGYKKAIVKIKEGQKIEIL